MSIRIFVLPDKTIVATDFSARCEKLLLLGAKEMPKDMVDSVFQGMEAIASNSNCTITDNYENEHFPFNVDFTYTKNIEEERGQKLSELKQYYSQQSQSAHIMSSVGIEINANDAASKDIEDLIRSIKGGIRSEPVSFCDYRNNFSNVSLENLEKMLLEVIQHQQILKDKKFAVRDIITRSDEPENIDVQQEFDKSMGKTLSSPNVLLPVDI